MVTSRKLVTFCSIFLILCQVMPLSIRYAYAETKESGSEKEIESITSPDLTNFFDEVDVSNPHISWHETHKQGTINEEMELTIYSDKEVFEVTVTIPTGVTILEEKLFPGISLKKGPSDQEVVITSSTAQKTFSLPIIIGETGTYEVVAEDSVATIQILPDSAQPVSDSISESIEEESQPEAMFDNNENEEAPIPRNNVSVGNFASLQAAISNAAANTETIITITNSFTFTSRITIPQDRNIRLQATSSRTLSNSGSLQHFLVTNSQLTLSDNVILDGGGVRVTGTTGLFTLNGGIVQNGQTSDGSSIDISSNAQMVINRGTIKDADNNSIAIWTGTVTMNGGTIVGGNNGLFLQSAGSGLFIMNEGIIENSRNMGIVINSTSALVVQNGGIIKNSTNSGVRVDRGIFQMTGGSIIGNSSGIFVGEEGIIDLTRGEIQNNQASTSTSAGGGIFFESLTNNQKISSAVDFSGNQADNHYAPPINVEQSFPGILSRSSSIAEYNHPLNGYDIRYRTSNPQINSLTITSNLESAGNILLNGEQYDKQRLMVRNSNAGIQAIPNEGYQFVRWEVVSGTGANIANATSATTTFTMGSANTTVRAVYETITQVSPVDPLYPETEVDPENKPELPEEQGLLSIDFVSSFNFGSQPISAQDQIYYAQPQRLLPDDQTVNENEERPNYIQVSDRRSENERNGWQLAVTQKEQFQTENDKELVGAQLHLMNQQLVTAQGGKEPSLQATNPLKLVPGNKRTLVRAEGSEGTGTWIYRFGNADTADKSIVLNVPKGANPEANHYESTLVWELSAVPGN